jgi:pyruvate carboxylase
MSPSPIRSSMMRGDLGQPPGGWPEGIQKKVLKGEQALTERPGKLLEPVDLEAARRGRREAGREIDDEELMPPT